MEVCTEDGAWRCHSQYNCTESCPKGISPTGAIKGLKRRAVAGGVKRIRRFHLPGPRARALERGEDNDMPTVEMHAISSELIREVAFELNRRAAIGIPKDVGDSIADMAERETQKLSKFVLLEIVNNYKVAVDEQRPMCADTGLPRFYAKIGNDAAIEGGFVALERSVRQGTADATERVPLRPNRVHPITRHDYNNNVGIHAPTVDYSWEPDVDWIELTSFHKGGLFGGDYRMLLPHRRDRRHQALLSRRDQRVLQARPLVPARHRRNRHRRHQGHLRAPRQGGGLPARGGGQEP